MLHGSHREEGDDSSEESLDEEDDDEEDDSTVAVRLPPPTAPNPTPSAPVMQNHHLRKGYPVKPARPPGPGTWKVVEEMIGAPIPRKARSSSVKRSQECWSGGGAAGGTGGGGVGGEQIHRQASMSPARPSPTSTTPVSPSSSNVSVRKKVKPISGSKHRLPKTSKTSSIQEIEIEVAEVLFGMTRQVPPKTEDQKHDAKESNGSGNEVKSRVSSPYPISPTIATSQPAPLRPSNQSSNSTPLTATAPKRKRPRMRFDDESPTSPPSSSVIPATSSSSAAKLDSEPTPSTAANKTDTGSPKSEKKSPVVEDSGVSCDPAISNTSPTAVLTAKAQLDSVKPESNLASDPKDLESRPEKRPKEEAVCPQIESTCANLDVKAEDAHASKAALISESQREEKFSFDLMALPGKSSPELECNSDHVTDCKSVEMEMVPESSKAEGEKTEKKLKTVPEEIVLVDNGGKLSTDNSDLSKHGGKDKNLDFHLDLEKLDNDATGSSKNQSLKQQSRAQRAEPKIEKPGPTASSPLPMQITGWPGGFPPFGYMGPVPPLPPVVPVDGSATSSKTVQSFLPSQLRPKRCAAHCYIAQNIHYHQQITRLNPFWPSAAGAAPLYASKQYNLNTAPPSDSAAILGATLQGGLTGRSLSSAPEKAGLLSAPHLGLSSKDKSNAAAAAAAAAQFMDASQRKAAALQQPSQPGSAGNMLAPAFIFPMHQQQASVQPAAVGTANRSGVAKLSPGSGNVAQSSNSAGYASVAASGANGPGTTMSFNYPGLPTNDAQYLAFLQNNAYSFPIPAHVGGAPPFRGGSPAQALPFFNLSFYPSQMLHPSQIRLQQQPASSQQPPTPYSQQGHQNPSTSSGSSSSQKNTQQTQRVPQAAASAATAGNSHGFPSSSKQQPHHHLSQQVRQMESETGGEDAPSTADSRVSQAQKGIYPQKFSIPAHTQNFALIAPATAAVSGGGGGNHGEKQQHQQQAQNQVMKMDLTPSQAFAMSFTSFGGAAAAAAAGGAAPHGLDFSSMAQNHALFQSLPEAARHGYQVSVAAHSAQQRHNKKAEDVKSAPDLGNVATIGEDGKMSSGNKAMGSQQQSLTFSRADAEPPQMSSVLGNSAIDGSSRTLNLIQQPPNGVSRVSNRPASASPASNSTSNSSHMLSQQQHHQQQQQVLQLQKQHQQLQLQQQLQQQQRAKPATSHNSASVYADRIPPGNSAPSKFPQGLAGFPPALIQSGASSQSGQWKATARAVNPSSATAAVAAASSSPSSSAKSQIPLQQQVRGQQPPPHQPHQISFGVSSAKAAGQSVPPSTVGSPQNSVSKSSGGSPHSSSAIVKSVPPTSPVLPVMPFQKQPVGKNSSSSGNSPLPAGNRNMPSILGNPHITAAPQNMGSKPQSSQHLQQSQLPKQHFPQAQFFFSNPYMQTQTSQSDMVAAAAAGYFQQQQQQRRQPDQQQSQSRQNSTPASTGMLSLGPSSSLSLTGGTGATPDPSKAGTITTQISNNSKSLTAAGLMQHQAQFAAAVTQPAAGTPAASHPLMSYIHAMQSVPLKPDVSAAGEQKPAAGR